MLEADSAVAADWAMAESAAPAGTAETAAAAATSAGSAGSGAPADTRRASAAKEEAGWPPAGWAAGQAETEAPAVQARQQRRW